MYLHLGQSVVVPYQDILGLFDMDKTTASHRTRAFLRACQQAVRVVESGGRRIPENAGRSASVSRPDPGKLTSRELADIRKRVMDGEKISF